MTEPESENTVLGHFSLHFKHIIIDEIALEGLEGITLDLLWRRIELRISAPVTEKMKVRFWKSILDMKDICVYQLPEPLPHFELRDRFTIVDHDTGDLKDPMEYLDGPYTYCPVVNEYGSCKYYESRNLIPIQSLIDIPYEKIDMSFGNTLVLVASIEKRWQALASHIPMTQLSSLMPIQYCLLELIGKSRENGQMTVGTSNLLNIVREPKNLFYHRKFLKNLNFIKVAVITQTIGPRGIKSLLLRLNRFHKPRILSLPKVGKTHKVIEYLRGCPNYSAKSDILLSMRFFTQPQTKKIRKNNNLFEFTDQDADEPPAKRPKPGLPKKRKIISIVTKSDESSQSEEETEKPVENRFKIGISLMRQAYEMFLEAGVKGVSQLELGQAMGIEFYTTRMLCKNLKAKKLIKEYSEDKGRQRIFRYVAVAAGINNTDYTEERQKFLKHIQNNPISFQLEEEIGEPCSSEVIIPNTPDLVPVSDLAPDAMKEYETTHISEISVTNIEKLQVKTLMESQRSLSLRQFKFANGIIKIVNAKQCVTGYQTLSNMVGKEIDMNPMGTKALKVFLKKLVAAGQVKLFKVRWPGRGNEMNYMHLICAPHIQITDPIIRNKYKEVHLRALAKRRVPRKEVMDEPCRPLAMYVNPRYMKIQKLHEMIMRFTYFEPIKDKLHCKPGFLAVPDFLPEITVKFAISNMSMTGLSEIAHLKVLDQHINMKLKDAPPEIAHAIMKCKSLKNSLRMNLKALGMYGLIQLVYQPDIQTADYFNSTLTTFLFYVNRQASILKTTGRWPRECDTASLERLYHFETAEDVKNYWRDVYDISIDTTIDITEPRSRKTLEAPVRREHEVLSYDNGARYGDGRGPCGMDSCFYLEISRLWRTYYVRETKPPNTQPKSKKAASAVKIPKVAKVKRSRKKKAATAAKPKPKEVINHKPHRGRKRLTATVSWSKEEDYIIVICIVALAIASPNSQPGALRVRNILARDILTPKDEKKTLSICHRRALMIQSKLTLMHEKECLLNEMRRRRHLILKYEGLIKKLRVRNPTNISKFMSEARVPMLELAYLIWQVSKSESYNKRTPCVAIDVKNFHENYNITPNTGNKMYNIYKTPEHAMLREAVFFTIMLSYNSEVKADKSRKIHAIFKKYPENNLRTVVEQLRRSSAVSVKEKIFNNQMHRLHLEDLSSSMYKVSAHYLRRWIGRLNSDFATMLPKLMENEMSEIPFKGSAEMNCLLCESQAMGYLKIETAIDAVVVYSKAECMTVMDIESKHKLKSGSVTWEKCGNVEWETDKVVTFYKDADFEPALTSLVKNAVVETEVKQEYDLSDVIVSHLHHKAEAGSSFKELLEITKYSSKDLTQRLQQLESQNVVKRVGLQDNVIILLKHIKNWAFQLDNKYVIITPWLNLALDIRIDIFLEWAGVIVNKAFEYPGCSIALLSDSFELITCRALQDICMFLEANKCVTLHICKCKTPDLFSDEDEMTEISEFNPYEATENICVFPVKNSITRYTYIRKLMLEKYLKDRLM